MSPARRTRPGRVEPLRQGETMFQLFPSAERLRACRLAVVLLVAAAGCGGSPTPTDLAIPPSQEVGGTSVAFSPDGRCLAVGGMDGDVVLREERQTVATLQGHSGAVWAVAFSPDGRAGASGGRDCRVILWDVATREPRAHFTTHPAWVCCVAFAPDGRSLA